MQSGDMSGGWFVLSHPEDSFPDRSGWHGIFQDIFGLTPRYLIAERGAQVVGVLPLAYQRSRLFGNGLIAAPFCVEGGPIAADDEAMRALVTAALAIQDQTGAPYLEFRSAKARQAGWNVRKDLYATFSGPLTGDDKENLLKIPRKQRAVVRKTIEGNLVGETTDRMDDVFHVYAESVRNLGTPVFSKRYFSRLKTTFGADCDAVVVRENGIPVSAVLNFLSQGYGSALLWRGNGPGSPQWGK